MSPEPLMTTPQLIWAWISILAVLAFALTCSCGIAFFCIGTVVKLTTRTPYNKAHGSTGQTVSRRTLKADGLGA
jgi:hypothetical protein